MNFPKISDSTRLERLQPPGGKIRMVIDTDTYNEVDDQFALVYALLSPEAVKIEAIYAAPFHNEKSNGPGDGMERSYQEILRLMKLMGHANLSTTQRYLHTDAGRKAEAVKALEAM